MTAFSVRAVPEVTEVDQVTEFLQLLADRTRLTILWLLARSDLRVSEIIDVVHLPSNAVSYHLKQLQASGLLSNRRSSADGRDVYYCADVDRLSNLYTAAGHILHPGLLPHGVPGRPENAWANLMGETRSDGTDLPRDRQDTDVVSEVQDASKKQPLSVLFLCTHNSARSQLAEGILRQLSGEQVEVYSAGSMPTEIHPDTIAVLQQLGIDPSRHVAKSMDQFRDQKFDYVITVCDRVRDACPVFPGDPTQIHWSFPDPVVVEDPVQRRQAFQQIAQELQQRVRYLLFLPHPATGQRFTLPR